VRVVVTWEGEGKRGRREPCVAGGGSSRGWKERGGGMRRRAAAGCTLGSARMEGVPGGSSRGNLVCGIWEATSLARARRLPSTAGAASAGRRKRADRAAYAGRLRDARLGRLRDAGAAERAPCEWLDGYTTNIISSTRAVDCGPSPRIPVPIVSLSTDRLVFLSASICHIYILCNNIRQIAG
jgi:hypothetical protein